MTAHAIRCFEAQTYEAKRLIIYDTSKGPIVRFRGHYQHCVIGGSSLTVGELRNEANRHSGTDEEIIVTWDSDENSHPNRIAEQVALLQSSGADCVGYNEMLFAREKRWCDCATGKYGAHTLGCASGPGEAWLYRNTDPHYALGTSLCYWRKTWERKPFEATSQGEDLRFIAGLKVSAVSAIPVLSGDWWKVLAEHGYADAPRMIARIHPGNTSTAYRPEAMLRESQKRNGMWKRVAEWDSYCAGQFKWELYT